MAQNKGPKFGLTKIDHLGPYLLETFLDGSEFGTNYKKMKQAVITN